MAINQNTLAKRIAEQEGLRVEVNIAQIKEVQRCLLVILANEYKMSDVVALLERHAQ